MFEKFINWTEDDHTRFRKVILMVVVVVWIVSTLFITLLYIIETYKVMSENLGLNGQSYSTVIMSAGSSINYFYAAICAALVSSYGFFTGTNVSLDIPKQIPMNQMNQPNTGYGYQQPYQSQQPMYNQQPYVSNAGATSYTQPTQTPIKTVLTPHPVTGKPTTVNPDD